MNLKALPQLSIVLGTLTTASFLLLQGEMTAAAVNFASGLTTMIATISALTLAADYCPKRSEAFAFAGLMSINPYPATRARSFMSTCSTASSIP